MTPERWRQIEGLLHTALGCPESEREELLRVRCADDAELADEVRSLLAVAEASRGFLESPAAGGVRALLAHDGPTGVAADNPGAMVGTRLGPYRLDAVIASGGMGTVFTARRDDDVYQKTVAVKVVRSEAGDLDPEGHAERLLRFTIERQVLADLDHPCIARLLDGGTTPEGRPFLVMEYVDGVPIDAY
ncbi:MAG: protein kinase, partial [Phycisphaerales bacterium]|nr:protein kinase [Phycisphaerales bacterium]